MSWQDRIDSFLLEEQINDEAKPPRKFYLYRVVGAPEHVYFTFGMAVPSYLHSVDYTRYDKIMACLMLELLCFD